MRVYVVWLMLVCCSLSGCVAAYLWGGDHFCTVKGKEKISAKPCVARVLEELRDFALLPQK